jgi:hypothetical protein
MKCLSASERHCFLQAIHKEKGYKTQSPLWPTGPSVSGSPYIPHYAVFLFSSLQIKIFLTSAVGVCPCFHSWSRLKNPKHVSSVHRLATQIGQAVTWGWYRLCQTGKGCLGMWLWPSGTLMESVFQEIPPPLPSYGGNLRLTFSLSVLLRRVSSLGNWGKALSPLQL